MKKNEKHKTEERERRALPCLLNDMSRKKKKKKRCIDTIDMASKVQERVDLSKGQNTKGKKEKKMGAVDTEEKAKKKKKKKFKGPNQQKA